MGQVDIPISMPGGFKSLGAAKAHREITSKVQSLREQATTTAEDMMGQDIADISSTPSKEWTDLAPGLGHVIMVGTDQDGNSRGVEVNYDPSTKQVRHFVAEVPGGRLTQGPASVGESRFSPTFKWEEGEGDKATTTYFKFDDQRGVISILDLDNDTPAILGDAKLPDLTGKTFQGGIPIITF